MSHRPRKRFGQHFLQDRSTIGQIMAALQPLPAENWLEIGPGLGALTLELLDRIGSLQAVEIDRDVIPQLAQAAASRGNLQLYQADALQFDYAQLVKKQKIRIFGNLPYNIATPLIFRLLEYHEIIVDMHFMLQKEVAERIAALPGTAAYGPLSIMVQYHCQAEMLFFIRPGAFYPPPKVDSAFIRLIPRPPVLPAQDLRQLRRVVQQAFSQRRKMLHNSLKEILTAEELQQLGIDPNIRPEQLTVEDFVKISNIL